MKLLDLLFIAVSLSGISSAIPTTQENTLEPITGTIVSTGVTENGEPYTITEDFVDLTDAERKLPITCSTNIEPPTSPEANDLYSGPFREHPWKYHLCPRQTGKRHWWALQPMV